MHNMMDNLLNTFAHSLAWHTGTKVANMFWVPLAIIFIGYGCSDISISSRNGGLWGRRL